MTAQTGNPAAQSDAQSAAQDGAKSAAAGADDLIGLLEATAAGDAAAFRNLYDATSAKLFGIVLRIIRDRGQAEDILQETYLRVWQKAEAYDPSAGRPVTWLATIARNRAIDRIRSVEHRISASRHGDDEMILQQIPHSDGLNADPAMREALRVCLEQLDEQSRECVVLAYCAGYSRDELAERMGSPVGTIKTWLHRSLKSLLGCLDG